jgi:hypothetical protein
MADPVVWYRSQRFIVLCQSTAVLVLGWVSAALATNDWAWRPIAIAVVGNVLVALKDWWSPNVVAPFAVLNRNNVVTVPASSVKDAEKSSVP